MPVKPHSRKRQQKSTYFAMPEVHPGDCVLFDINPNWLDPQPGRVVKVHGNNSVDILGFVQRYGQLEYEGAIHRDDPMIEAFPDRFDGNENAVWELAPQTVLAYQMRDQLAKLEARVLELEGKAPSRPQNAVNVHSESRSPFPVGQPVADVAVKDNGPPVPPIPRPPVRRVAVSA